MSELRRPLTVGITGPRGFIAGHLARRLAGRSELRVIPCQREDFWQPQTLRQFVRECDTVVHLAGMNRGEESEVYQTNVALVDTLVDAVRTRDHRPPHVIFASTTQRDRENAYGRSKWESEQRLQRWAHDTGGLLTVLVIPNVYGPGCRPFYNSVVATFCHQLAHGEQPVVSDDREIDFVWIHDLVDAIESRICKRREANVEVLRIPATTRQTVSQLLASLQAIRRSYFETHIVPDLSDRFLATLYTTFLSYVELEDHCHRPQLHSDTRGELFEVLRLAGGGQIFFSTTKPGVIRGNHFHLRKVEWFCVVRGEAVIRLRRIGDDRVREFRVSGASPQFISIPPLHAHQIENVGEQDLLTMFWCSEIFQPADPDTFYEQVA